MLRPRAIRTVLILSAALFLRLSPAFSADATGWPRMINPPEAKILVYQPQIDGQEGNIVTARSAVSITLAGKTEPIFGTIWFRARADVDRDNRMVYFADVTVPKTKFPGSTPEREQRLAEVVEKEIPNWALSESLDRLIASLEIVEKEKAYAEGFNTKPPKIFVEKVPTILILIDGDPALRAVEGSTSLKRVVNTPFFLVFDGKTYYLSGGAAWFTTTDLKGEWSTTKSPPKEVAAYFEKTQAQEKASKPKEGQKAETLQPKEGDKPPKIIVSTQPAELILTDGEAKFAPITGTDLLYVTNTEDDIILDMAGQESFVLLSGRWFKSKSMKEPWVFVKPESLPPDFKKIPEPSPKGDVLASVAGTPQAEEALTDSQVPQTAAVKRKEATTKVEYDGEPQFKQIPDTEIQSAVNTSSQVLKVEGKYYVCDQAIWFVGDSAKGPWTVADKIPGEIQKIPPESPAYNVKYVYIYDSTPEVVYVGYTPGYVGCYPYYGTVVWGTGWYYPPYISPYVYYPRPVTFGFSAHYNPYYGWSFGFGISSGPFTISFWGGGHYGGYWGPAYHGGYYHGGNTVIINNPGGGGRYPAGGGGAGARPTPYGSNSNIYNNAENKGRTASTMDKSANRPQAKPATGQANNVYSDKAGNVYRRDDSGNWQSREGNSWKSAQGGDAGARPSTGTGTGSRPDTGGGAGAGAKPSTGAGTGSGPSTGGGSGARPSTGTGSTGRPSGGSGASAGQYPSGGGAGSGPSGLNRDYSARQQGAQRTQSYHGGGYGGGGGGGRRR